MKLGEAKVVLQARINEIKQDDRWKAGQKHPAQVQINAPLALIQVEMEAKISAYEFALSVLSKVKS